ncbi:MAG: hypothetical protein V4580_02035 [Bacteroidota bacterium]
MTENDINKIVTELSKALEMRDYGKFVSFFDQDAIFEIPFTVEGGTVLKGLPKIKEHFENVSKSPLGKLIQIDNVNAKSYFSSTSDMVTIEYFTKGKAQSTGENFEIQSSIALVQFKDSHIVHYKDFPNTIGIAKKAGILQQLAATWTK